MALRSMYQRSRVATCVDFLSSYVDFQKAGAYHTDPSWALAASKRLTRRVFLRHDYMPYEFSIFLFRDDTISEAQSVSGFRGRIGRNLMKEMKLQPNLSIVIPVFNEEAVLPALVERLRVFMERLSPLETEVILVDDRSLDRSPELLKEICRRDPRFRFARLAKNSGSHVAILAGLAAGARRVFRLSGR